MTAVQDPVYRPDVFRCHLSSVDTLISAGIGPPSEWLALRDRFGAFVELARPAADRLAEEVMHPSPGADLVMLRAAAITEELATAEADAAVTDRVRAAALQQLLAVYRPRAVGNYKAAAAQYDTAAKRFSLCASTVDVESDGNTLVSATTSQRDAWLDAPAAAADLEDALRVLCAAAALAGAPPDVAFLGQATDIATSEYQIAIAADPGKAHRRKVWLAWLHSGGRTGRWAKLCALAVKLRAADHRVSPYKRPDPMVAVVDRGNKLQKWDPHDGKPPKGWRFVQDGWASDDTESSVI